MRTSERDYLTRDTPLAGAAKLNALGRFRSRQGGRARRWAGVLALLVSVSGCGFFDDDDDFGVDGETSGDGDGDGDGDEELPPTRGFLVFPKFMLQDVPAIVTLDVDGPSALACPPADAQTGAGGYLCDADELDHGSVATILVERDGFEPATRTLEVPFNQIVAVDVHLAVEGGPSGSLSACTPAGAFESCAELCEASTSSCLVTACVGTLPDAPIVSFETYADAECLEPLAGEALTCASALPDSGSVVSVRCCCG